MSKFYTSVIQSGNAILIREIVDGVRINRRENYQPTLYVKSNKLKSKYKTVYGDPVEPIKFENILAAKDWVNSYKDTPNFPIFGNTYFNFSWLAEKYPGEIEYNFKHISVWSIDIECEAEKGFPKVENASERINLITFKNIHTQEIWSFGLPFKKQLYKTDRKNVHYESFSNEEDMCAAFLNKWAEVQPDIIMGWNCIPLNSHIWTKTGIKSFKDIKRGELLLDSEVKNIFPVTNKQIYKIKLNNGIEIESSKEHIFPYVKLEKGKYSSLQFGKKEQALKSENSIKNIKKEMDKNSLYFYINCNENNNKRVEGITDSQLYCLGAIYTDGTFLKNKNNKVESVAFYNTNEEMIKFVNEEFKRHKRIKSKFTKSDGIRPNGKKGIGTKRTRLWLSTYNPFRDYIEYIFDKKCGKKKLNIEKLSQLSKRQFMVFMSGCLDGDGCVSDTNNVISLCNYNNDIPIFEELMRWNGYMCSIQQNNKNVLTIPNVFKEEYGIFCNHSKKKISLKKITYILDKNTSSNNISYRKISTNQYLIRVDDIFETNNFCKMQDIETNTHYFSYAGIKTHNCEFFDLPYLISRMHGLFGPDVVRKALSPWSYIHEKTIDFYGQDMKSFDIGGVAVLDYFRLYKKYIPDPRENYKLGFIAETDLNIGKLDHEEYATFSEFYKNNWQKYVDYNIRDVELVEALDKKWKLIDLLLMVAYRAKINYEDVLSQTKVWDMLIFNYLRDRNIVIPMKVHFTKDKQFDGAYVKEPIPGLYNWVVSVDFESLYPKIMMILNMGFENKVLNGPINTRFDLNPTKVTNKNHKEYLKFCKEHNQTLSVNGACFTKEKKSVYADLLMQLFNLRLDYKGKLKEAKKAGHKDLEAKFDTSQLAVKIILNSLFGACGTNYFRYFDLDIAEGITHTGQFVINFIQTGLNEFLNESLGTKKKVFVVYQDTDSAYITLDELVKLVFPDGAEPKKIVDYLDKFVVQVLQPKIAELCETICNDYLNGMDPKLLKMNREVIADKAILVAKKRYILNVLDSEGEKFGVGVPKPYCKDCEASEEKICKSHKNPKIKIKGLETSKSTVLKFCRDRMKECIKIILNTGDNNKLIELVEKTREEFYKMSPYDVSLPKGCKGLLTYANEKNIYGFKTPMHVRGSLLYNYYLKKLDLVRKYQFIQEGEKIRYLHLKKPNHIRENVISFNGNHLPEEFGLEKFIDWETQFEKTFLQPLNIVLKAIKWKDEKIATLEKWF